MKVSLLQLTPTAGGNQLPLFAHRVRAGFPSPADDYLERSLNLHELLVRHPAATYFARAEGDSMQNLGIFSGDLLVIDRSVSPQHGDIVIAAYNGELACKVLDIHQRRLLSANERFPPIELPEDPDLLIEGVVTASIRQHRVCAG